MKSKLITMAVASTFGWSAGAFAANGHEVITPFSVNDTGEVLPQQQSAAFTGRNALPHAALTPSTSSSSYSDTSGTFSSQDQSASLNMDESLALSDGIYSDVYVVNWTPTTSEDWMSYVQPQMAQGAADVVIYDIAIVEPDTALDSASVG
jgi:hypothetical protein